MAYIRYFFFIETIGNTLLEKFSMLLDTRLFINRLNKTDLALKINKYLKCLFLLSVSFFSATGVVSCHFLYLIYSAFGDSG